MASVKVVVKGKNLDVTPALRGYAEKKIVKFEKYLTGEQEVLSEVTLRTEREMHISELTMVINGRILRGEGSTEDMYASIDDSVDKIERQFSKYKSKIQRRVQGPKISELPSQAGTSEAETKEAKIVRTKRFAFKPMDAEEAVLQMELLGHNFFVFSNAATDDVTVVYKRRDGNYGLIEPEF